MSKFDFNEEFVFDSEFLAGLENITALDLSSNDLKSMRMAKSFQSLLPNLEMLDLGWNSYESIEPGAFDGLSKLVELDLRHCRLKTLEKGCFKSLANLKTLNLLSNTISEIQQGAFNGLSNITCLDLVGNELDIISPGVFHGLDNLEILDICSSAELYEIKPGTFICLKNLQWLDFSYSQSLNMIESKAFAHLTELKTLKLKGWSFSPIRSIDPSAFDDLNNIEELDLSGNELSKFETTCSPKKITLRGNNLRSVKFTGSDLWRIEEIDLLDNLFLRVDTNDLSPLCCLKSLSLSSIQINSLRGLTNLTHLNLDLTKSGYLND